MKEHLQPMVVLTSTDIESAEPSARLKEVLETGVRVEWDARRNFTISEPDHEPKFSEGYIVCVGFLLLGTDEAGRTVSMMSHEGPSIDRGGEYLQVLTDKINRFLSMVNPATVTGYFFGGTYTHAKGQPVVPRLSDDKRDDAIRNESADTINRLLKTQRGREVEFKVLAFPRVTPHGGIESSYAYDTETNRFFVIHKKDSDGYFIEPVLLKEFPAARNAVRVRHGAN